MIQLIHNASGVYFVGSDTKLQAPKSPEAATGKLSEFQNNVLDVTHETFLSNNLTFLNFDYVDWQSRSHEDELYIKYFNNWPLLTKSASYILNETVSLGAGILPYNSSITLNNTLFNIEAPFLDVSYECYHPYKYFTALGNCVCYDAVPLTTDWYRDKNLVCLDSSFYTWGYSSYMVYGGLISEMLWIPNHGLVDS